MTLRDSINTAEHARAMTDNAYSGTRSALRTCSTQTANYIGPGFSLCFLMNANTEPERTTTGYTLYIAAPQPLYVDLHVAKSGKNVE